MGQKHGGQVLLEDSVGQLRWLSHQACPVLLAGPPGRSGVASVTTAEATLLSVNFALDTFQDRRQPEHQDAAASGTAAGQHLPQSSQPVPSGEPLDDRPLSNCPVRGVVLTERDKQLLTELPRASAMALPRCAVSRHATAWAEGLEGAMSGHQSWALICRYRCRLLLAEIAKGVDRKSELKQRLHLWESGQISGLISRVLGQQNSGPLRRAARRVQPQQSHEGTGGRRRADWTTALIPRSSGTGTHPTSAEGVEAARIAWVGGRYEQARSAMREQGRSKTGIASLPHVKLAPMSAPGAAGERQEHLDAIVSFAGAGQRRRLFRGLDILTIKWATGDLPEECRFLLNKHVSRRLLALGEGEIGSW